MIDPRIPSLVIRRVLEPLQVIAAKEVPPGLSGAVVFRCQRADGHDFALKRWPGKTTRERVEEVHRVMARARENGCHLVPELLPIWNSQTILIDGSGLWEAQQWVQGSSTVQPTESLENLGPHALPGNLKETLVRIENGARAIRHFHDSVRELGVVHQVPLAVESRMKRVGELNRQLPQLVDRMNLEGGSNPTSADGNLDSAILDACRLIGWKWGQSASRIARSMGPHLNTKMETQYVLRDIHREHMFFKDQTVSGLIDFDAVRVDTPLTDLARWAGSWMTDCDETGLIWRAASAGFFQNPPFQPGGKADNQWKASGPQLEENQIKFAKELCFATNWISLGNWLIWLRAEKRTFPGPPTALATRIRQLIRSCSHEF
jgi:hypothetical protein